jgi:4-amino-4-deoxy-L-arabinose transferase-like glycosyltransferase
VRKLKNKAVNAIVATSFILLIISLRRIFPERSMTHVGSSALWDAFYALLLVGIFVVISSGIGTKALRYIGLNQLTRIERFVFCTSFGLGIIAYGVLFIGLLNLLNYEVIVAYLLFIGIVASSEIKFEYRYLLVRISGEFADFMAASLYKKSAIILIGFIFLTALFQTFVPVFEYDALMYHLNAPKIYLEQGQITYLSEIWQANVPSTINMLYTMGLMLGSESAAKTLHWFFSILLALSIFSAARYLFNREIAWLSTLLFIATPLVIITATFAHADLAWGLYEFLAVYGIFLWQRNDERKYLLISGVMIGFALGNQYLALYGALLISIWIIWFHRYEPRIKITTDLLWFGLSASLTASPWYLKNLIWTGNPVFPFLFGGSDWDVERLGYLMGYMNSFGTKGEIWEFLLVPLNIFIYPGLFGTLSIEILNPLVLLAFVLPFLKKKPVINAIAILVLFRFILWATGSQQIRFLIPIFPLLSILSAYSLCELVKIFSFQFFSRVSYSLTIGVSLIVTFAINIILIINYDYIPVVTGSVSKHNFLSLMDSNYLNSRYIMDHLPEASRALMLWDGRGYYCNDKCLIDAEQSLWTQIVISSQGELGGILEALSYNNITHISWIINNETYFTQDHDPTGVHNYASSILRKDFIENCGELVFQNGTSKIYRIQCRDY